MTEIIESTEPEVWKLITFAEGGYEVSNHGRVKSYFSKEESRILKGGIVGGYVGIGIRVNSERKRYLVHRLVAEFFNDKPTDKHNVVIHLDGNRYNNLSSNLKWVTSKESFLHTELFNPKVSEAFRSREKKLLSNAKLNLEDVAHIKKMIKSGIKQNLISKLFAVSEMQITRIKRGENWSDV